jgi:four helix bundle protein
MELLSQDHRSSAIAGQLCRSAGSIAANIAEGYGRRSPIDRARYFEYALGSAAESRTWYITCRAGLPAGLAERRLEQVASVTRLLLVMIKNERMKVGTAGTRGVRRDAVNRKDDE